MSSGGQPAKPTMTGTNGKSFYDDDSDAGELAARVPKTKNPAADRPSKKGSSASARTRSCSCS